MKIQLEHVLVSFVQGYSHTFLRESSQDQLRYTFLLFCQAAGPGIKIIAFKSDDFPYVNEVDCMY